MQNFAEELSMDYESNKLQFDMIRRMSFGYLKDLKEKKKHFYSFKTGLEDRLQDLEAKERQFEESVKEFKLREKSLILSEKQLKITVKICSWKRKKLSNILQLLLNQYLKKHDFLFGEIFDTIKKASALHCWC